MNEPRRSTVLVELMELLTSANEEHGKITDEFRERVNMLYPHEKRMQKQNKELSDLARPINEERISVNNIMDDILAQASKLRKGNKELQMILSQLMEIV